MSADIRSSLLPHSCLIVMPAHNEEANIASVIADIHSHYNYEIVVVDDKSTDQTIARAKSAGATVIPLREQLGAWGATQTGLRYALIKGYNHAISMDADGQHRADSISQLMQPIIGGEADMVLGSCTQRGSKLRHIAWFLLKRVSALSYEDITSGLRIYNRPALELLAQPRATMIEYQDVGVLLLLQSLGLRIAEVRVTMRSRKNGKSRVFNSWSDVAYYMAYTLLLGLTKRKIRQDKAA